MKDYHFEVGGIRPIEPLDVFSVGTRLREQDHTELTLNGKRNPFRGLMHSLNYPHSYTIEVLGNPEGLFGICPTDFSPRAGCVWMVGTDVLIEKASLTFGKTAKKVLDDMLRDSPKFRYVMNFVHEENTVAIAWLKSLGFSITHHQRIAGMRFSLLYKDNPYYV
jgi:hypothetical protein